MGGSLAASSGLQISEDCGNHTLRRNGRPFDHHLTTSSRSARLAEIRRAREVTCLLLDHVHRDNNGLSMFPSAAFLEGNAMFEDQ